MVSSRRLLGSFWSFWCWRYLPSKVATKGHFTCVRPSHVNQFRSWGPIPRVYICLTFCACLCWGVSYQLHHAFMRYFSSDMILSFWAKTCRDSNYPRTYIPIQILILCGIGIKKKRTHEVQSWVFLDSKDHSNPIRTAFSFLGQHQYGIIWFLLNIMSLFTLCDRLITCLPFHLS